MNQSFTEMLAKYKKIIITFSVMLGALLFGAVVFIVSSLGASTSAPLISLPQKSLVLSPTPAIIRAQMFMSPRSLEIETGKQFKTTVAIQAKNKSINGVDSVVLFDPQYVKVIKVVKNPETPAEFVLARKLTENNKILLTLIKSETNDATTAELSFADITFQAVKPGNTTITFEHMPGKTIGSTVIQADDSQNILDQVIETHIVIK